MPPPTLGSLIREAREAREMTQAELAGLIERSGAYLSMIENDQRLPDLDELQKLGALLRVEAAALFRAHPDYPVWSKVLGGAK